MIDKKEGILFIIDCLNSHKYNFDYNLEELIKEAKKLQSNWNSLRECVDYQLKHNVGSSAESSIRNHVYQEIKDKMNELERKDMK